MRDTTSTNKMCAQMTKIPTFNIIIIEITPEKKHTHSTLFRFMCVHIAPETKHLNHLERKSKKETEQLVAAARHEL